MFKGLVAYINSYLPQPNHGVSTPSSTSDEQNSTESHPVSLGAASETQISKNMTKPKSKRAEAAAPAPRGVALDLIVAERPIYVPGSGPPLQALSLLPPHDKLGIIEGMIQIAHDLQYIVVFENSPLRVNVRQMKILDWVSPRTFEEYQSKLASERAAFEEDGELQPMSAKKTAEEEQEKSRGTKLGKGEQGRKRKRNPSPGSETKRKAAKTGTPGKSRRTVDVPEPMHISPVHIPSQRPSGVGLNIQLGLADSIASASLSASAGTSETDDDYEDMLESQLNATMTATQRHSKLANEIIRSSTNSPDLIQEDVPTSFHFSVQIKSPAKASNPSRSSNAAEKKITRSSQTASRSISKLTPDTPAKVKEGRERSVEMQIRSNSEVTSDDPIQLDSYSKDEPIQSTETESRSISESLPTFKRPSKRITPVPSKRRSRTQDESDSISSREVFDTWEALEQEHKLESGSIAHKYSAVAKENALKVKKSTPATSSKGNYFSKYSSLKKKQEEVIVIDSSSATSKTSTPSETEAPIQRNNLRPKATPTPPPPVIFEDDDEEEEKEEIEEEGEEYPVEKLLRDKYELNPQGKRIRLYLVKWEGNYDDTWEPAENIGGDIIKTYEDEKRKKRKARETPSKGIPSAKPGISVGGRQLSINDNRMFGSVPKTFGEMNLGLEREMRKGKEVERRGDYEMVDDDDDDSLFVS